MNKPPVKMDGRVRWDMRPRYMKPGDVLLWRGGRYLMISNQYPADTVPRPDNLLYCEPGLIRLKKAEGREAWYETHEFTYMLLTARKEYRILRHPEVVTL